MEKPFRAMFLGHKSEQIDPEVIESIEKSIDDIEKAVMSGEFAFVGDGSTCRVYMNRKYSGLCFKIIDNVEEYKKVNNVTIEKDIMVFLYEDEECRKTMPEPYYYIISDDAHILVMEKLNAVTLSGVLDAGSPMPENFESDIFFDELTKFIKHIHKLGVHHRDLSAANVMIDLDTGLPKVIDFGKSVNSNLMNSEDPYIIPEKGQIYMRDSSAIMRLKKRTKEYLEKNN